MAREKRYNPSIKGGSGIGPRHSTQSGGYQNNTNPQGGRKQGQQRKEQAERLESSNKKKPEPQASLVYRLNSLRDPRGRNQKKKGGGEGRRRGEIERTNSVLSPWSGVCGKKKGRRGGGGEGSGRTGLIRKGRNIYLRHPPIKKGNQEKKIRKEAKRVPTATDVGCTVLG